MLGAIVSVLVIVVVGTVQLELVRFPSGVPWVGAGIQEQSGQVQVSLNVAVGVNE